MNNSLYPKLAFLNIRKNGRMYIPYILSSVITIAMFYVMCSITFNDEAIGKLQGAQTLQSVLFMGIFVIALFSFIFLFYTNSFLMKRRKKEIGLYNILGMEKRHVSRIMIWEVLMTSVSSIIVGLLFGILFDKLVTMLLFKILKCNITFGFSVRPFAVLVTIGGFLLIYLINLIYDIAKVRLSNPIELLHGSNVGEKEPKTKWVLAILGVICLAAGYTIAIIVESPLEAIALFFIAVILVIIGTYCLFVAGSIAILKALRKNKKYYYNPKHFTSVSGMLYRMKQNAVGLANICILSTMVLVMISTTVCLYVGADDAMMKRYPRDAAIVYYVSPERTNLIYDVEEYAKQKAADEGRILTNATVNTDFSVTTGYVDGKYNSTVDNSISANSIYIFCFKSETQYERLTGKDIDLKGREAIAYTAVNGKNKKTDLADTFNFNDKDYTVVDRPETMVESSQYTGFTTVVYYVIVSDEELLNIYNDVNERMNGENMLITTDFSYDIDGEEEDVISFNDELYEKAKEMAQESDNDDVSIAYSHETRAGGKDSFYSLYGSFLFLGIYLGAMFLMITALIMYYKQISEGFDDKERFEIMQKVGMSKEEIRKSIHSQVITVFFMPLVMSLIHIAFAFKMITRLMVVLNLTNVTLFLVCTIITALIFAVIYAIVYALTARSYTKIVE